MVQLRLNFVIASTDAPARWRKQMSTWTPMTPHQQLTALLSAAQVLANEMLASGVWDELLSNCAESIDAAVLQLAVTHALTSNEKAVRAASDATDWRITERKEAA